MIGTVREVTAMEKDVKEDLLYEAVMRWLQEWEVQVLIDEYRESGDVEAAEYIDAHRQEVVQIATEIEEEVQERVRRIVESEGDGEEEEV